MRLELDPGDRQAATEARRAAGAGELPAMAGRTVTQMVAMAAQWGRATGPVSFYSTVLAHLLGWPEPDGAAVGLIAGPGVIDRVPGAATASVLLLQRSARVLEVYRPDQVRLVPHPTLDDPSGCRVEATAGRGTRFEAEIGPAVVKAALVRTADGVGAAEAAFDWARRHTLSRTIKGTPLADRQVVRHRLADMHIDLTVSGDAVYDAAGELDRGASGVQAERLVAYAKSSAAMRSMRVVAGAQQMAGGIGILEEQPLHLWARRVRAAAFEWGDPRRQLDVIAAALLDG